MARHKPPEVPNVAGLIYGVGKVVEGVVKRELEKFAKKSADKFRGMIERQEFKSFKELPLAPGWAVYKANHDLDPRTMIATGNYAESIKAIKIKNGWRVGFEEDAQAVNADGENQGLTLNELAAIQEKSRPHWAPFREIMKDDLVKAVKRLNAEIAREMPGRLHVPRNKAP